MKTFIGSCILAIQCAGSPLDSFTGTVFFLTQITAVIDAPVSTPDGRGAGLIPGMVAQLFHIENEVIIPLEPRTMFQTGLDTVSPFYTLPVQVEIPGTHPFGSATIRMRWHL